MRETLCDDCRYSPMKQSEEPCHTGTKLGIYVGGCAGYRPTIGTVEHAWVGTKRKGRQDE